VTHPLEPLSAEEIRQVAGQRHSRRPGPLRPPSEARCATPP